MALLAALTLLALGLVQAQAASGSVRVGGARIAYRVDGHGPAMMLVHGFPLSGELFARNRPALARRYRVVTPDLRGFGHSTAPDSSGSVQIYARDILAVMDHLNIKKAIIGGMSMGGPVVLEMYREAPQRFRGLILIDSTTSPAAIVEQAQWPGFGKQGSVKGAVGGGHALATRPDSRKTKIRVPVLIVVGIDDPIYPVEMQQKIHQDTPGSRLAVIPGAAHAAIIEQAGAANKAILAWAGGLR